jgi:hypothetical protein
LPYLHLLSIRGLASTRHEILEIINPSHLEAHAAEFNRVAVALR